MTSKPGRSLYAILREDTWNDREVVVTAIRADTEAAEREVKRLNELRGSANTRYWWLATRTRGERIRIEVQD